MTASLPKRCAAELAGTAALVGIGTGAIVAGTILGGVPQYVLAVAWFAAVAIPVLACARTSGAHLNPAVTLALVGARAVPASEGAAYAAAQTAGAFLGSATVLTLLGGEAHLGATLPSGGDIPLAFLLEFCWTLALVLTVLRLAHLGRFPTWIELLAPAVVVGLSTYLIGPLTGSSLNPARSLAPAVLSGDSEGLWAYFLAAAAAALVGVLVERRIARWYRSKEAPQVPAA